MRITTWVYWHLAKPTMSAYVVCPARYLGSNVTEKGIFLPCDKGSLGNCMGFDQHCYRGYPSDTLAIWQDLDPIFRLERLGLAFLTSS